jgi:hypothetical protein
MSYTTPHTQNLTDITREAKHVLASLGGQAQNAAVIWWCISPGRSGYGFELDSKRQPGTSFYDGMYEVKVEKVISYECKHN